MKLSGLRLKQRMAFARERVGCGGEGRAKLASGEIVEGAEAACEFYVAQAAFAIKPTQKVDGGALSFLRIASQTAGNQVAVGIAAERGLRHDVVKAASLGRKLTQTIEATAPFPRVDGLSEGRVPREIHALGVNGGVKVGLVAATKCFSFMCACGEDLGWQEDLHHVSGFAALQKAEDAARDEATDGPARGVSAEADAARKPWNRKPEARLAFQTAMPQEM